MKFTPGPWKAHKLPKSEWMPKRWEIHYSNDGECVAEIVHEDADAQLIAAAPDMYEALRKAFNLKCAVPDCRRNNEGDLNLNFCHIHNVIYKALDKVGDVEDYD